jgi:putative membrane protein
MIGPTDQQFVMKAAQGGKMEVELAQMAQQKSTNDAVKQLAQKIEQDHTQANKELMDVAKLRGVDVSSATPEAKSQAMKDKLSKLSGADFDKAYLKMMLSDHKKDIKEFERESNRGMDTDVKAFASKTLPALKEHLQMTENVQKGLSGTSASSSSNSMKSSPSGTSDSTNTTTERGTRSRSTDATPGNQPNKGTGTTTTPPQ